MARLHQFGVIFGYDRVVLYVEPFDVEGLTVSSNTSRTQLLRNGQPLPYAEWAVEFRAKIHNHHARKVLEFRWFNVPVPPNCADSFEGTHFSMRVNRHRRFHGTYPVPNANRKAIVHGRFKRSGKKATGTLRLKGNFSGGCVNADTGALHWVARKNG